MPAWNRYRRVVCSSLLAFLGLCALGWLWLYLDSLYELRRAEHLIADLKSLPFSSAGFHEVRDFVNLHGGAPILQFPNLQSTPPGLPQIDEEGHLQMPAVGQYPTCTPQDCRFEITVKPRVWRISMILMSERTPSWIPSALASFGIRPWIVGVDFEIHDGLLLESRTAVAQMKHSNFGSYSGLASLGYSIHWRAHLKNGEQNGNYILFKPHITGVFADVLIARVISSSNVPMQRAFDINLHCFTAVFRACNGLDELDHSAFADFQAEEAKQKENNN
jgi:hypothetical protein